jgi:tetratricopeptide (TPR) repeat protein
MAQRVCSYVLLLVVNLWGLSASAQTPSGAAPPVGDYSREAAVGQLLSLKANFENDGTSTQELTLRARIQSDAGVKRYGLLTFTYQGATQTIEVEYLRVRKPDGSVIVTPPDNIQDMDAGITREAPFYSDLREKHAAVKGLSPGDVLEYQVRWHTTKPLAPGQFWYDYNFEHEAILLDEQLQVSVPRDRPIKMKSPSVKPAITEAEGRRIYTWKTSNLENHSKENEASKTIDANLGRSPQPDVQISSFQSWEEVGKWYWGLQQERIQPTSDVRSKAADLTKGATDPAVVLHSVYDFVSTKFRYIGVAFGIGRYQPHSADDVLGNQYGDCKDKHTLFASLLQATGVTAYPALISSSRKLDADVPSPAQFDHVISVVPQGQNFLWLDTTAEVGPFGYLLPQLRDKQALVMPGDKPAMLVTTPANLPFPSINTFTIDGKLNEDGTLESKMDYTSRGDSEIVFRSAFRLVPQPQWKDLVQQVSYSLGFAGTVSEATASSPESTATPFHFSYSYNRKDYPDWSTHQITVPGLPFSLPQVSEEEAHAKDPIWLGPVLELVSDAKVELPKGYAPELPSDVVLVRDYAEYRATYRQDRGVLISHRELQIKVSQVPDAEKEDYKKFTKNLGEDVNRYVVLTASSEPRAPSVQDPANASLSAALRTLPDSSSAEAQKFEKEAFNSMGPNQPAAVDALKRAVAADPKFTRGWVTLGSLYMALSQTNAGLDAFHKAIDSDPNQPVSYEMLATALMSQRKVEDAIQVWQALLKVAPEDRNAIRNLGELFYVDKRYAEAVQILETEVRLNPSAEGPLTRLGIAYLKSGEVDKGYATLQQLLKIDSGPSSLNNVAYELADANVKLSDALDYAEKAVRTEEEASVEIRLPSLTDENLHSTRRIASFWDTLGWVQFHLGHLDEAEKYLRASWMLSQHGIAADHLGQLYELKQRRTDAIHMYRLAIRANSVNGPSGDPTQIQAHLSHLVPGANLSTGFDLHRGDPAGDELSQMRNVKLSRFFQGSANADFFLLFGPGAKLEDVKFIKGSDKLEGAGKFIRAAIFPILYPDGSKAQVVRRGILSCSSLTGCSLVLYTPDAVTSVN